MAFTIKKRSTGLARTLQKVLKRQGRSGHGDFTNYWWHRNLALLPIHRQHLAQRTGLTPLTGRAMKHHLQPGQRVLLFAPRFFPGIASHVGPDLTEYPQFFGYGDLLMCCRWLPYLVRQGVTIIFVGPEKLCPLLAGQDGVEAALVGDDTLPSELPPVDVCGLLVDLEDPFDLDHPSISPCARVPSDTAFRMPKVRPGHLKIGLIWKSSPEHFLAEARHIPVELFAPLFRISDAITWCSLQLYAEPRERLLLHALNPAVIDLSRQLTDWSETAAAFAQLSLLVAVETGPVYLADNLGIPSWALMPQGAAPSPAGVVTDRRWPNITYYVNTSNELAMRSPREYWSALIERVRTDFTKWLDTP